MTVRMTSTFHESDNNNQASPGSSTGSSPQTNSTHIHQTYNWFYDKTELRRTPSFLDGINFERERRYRNEGARFILNVGSQMKLRYNTLATGVVYFHRFYMFHSFKVFPRYVTSACCLFLAGKAEETPKKCKDIIKIARSLLTDPQYQTFGEDPKEEVLTMERIVLQTIRFDLQVEHPYKYLATYAKGFKGNREKITTVLQMAWTFTNDSLCTTISLQWEPEIVAIAMIFLASKIKYEITDWEGRLPHQKHWWDIYVEDLTVEMLEDICHQVLDLYSPKRAEEPRADSPPLSPVGTSGQRPGLAPLQHPHLGPTNAPVGPMSNSQANHLGSGLQPPPQPPIRSQPQPPVHSTAGNSVSLSNPPIPPISSGNLPLIPPNLPPNAIPLRLLAPTALVAAAAAVNGPNSSAQGPPLPPLPPPIPPQWDPNSMASFYGQCPFPLPGAPQQNAPVNPGGPPVPQHLPPRLVPLGAMQPPPGLHPRGLPPLPLPPGALPRGLPPPPQPPMPPSLTFMPGQRKP